MMIFYCIFVARLQFLRLCAVRMILRACLLCLALCAVCGLSMNAQQEFVSFIATYQKQYSAEEVGAVCAVLLCVFCVVCAFIHRRFCSVHRVHVCLCAAVVSFRRVRVEPGVDRTAQWREQHLDHGGHAVL